MDKIVGIFGVPRSGTSWLGQIFNSSPETRFAFQPMFADEFYGGIHPYSTSREMLEYFETIYNSQRDFLTQPDHKDKPKKYDFKKYSTQPEVFVFKEVMFLYMVPFFLEKLPNMKAVLLVRNPYGVLQSWYNAPKEFYPEWNIEEEWLFAQRKNGFLPERYYGYHRWKEWMALVNAMKETYPNSVMAIRYEDLVKEPHKTVRELFAFVGVKFEEQTDSFIIKTQSRTENNPYSIFRDPNKKQQCIQLPSCVVDSIYADFSSFPQMESWYDAKIYYDQYCGIEKG